MKRKNFENEKSLKFHKKIPEDDDIQRERRNLPIYSMKEKLIEEFKKHKTIVSKIHFNFKIIVGETGSGKTTQIPQYIFESGILKNNKKVAITQPRRVAATKEMSTKNGELVGYSIRFEDCTSNKTQIKYLTDGMLIREAQIDPLLSKYQTIILDEAHERTVNTDVLFGVVKMVQKKREDLQVIVMSATLEAESFAKFFDAKIINIQGRQFPVELYYTDEPQSDYVEAATTASLQIHLDEGPGDILVFLTGQEEIESVASELELKARYLPPEAMKLIVCPIFAALPSEKQMEAFDKAPEGCRKVILATNIAETSITINNIKYVVDTGYVKLRWFNPTNGLDSLKVAPISKASAAQRLGRAGRESSGKCFRLYTEETFDDTFLDFTIPEIQRTNMAEVVLQMKSMGIDNILNFEFIDKPSVKTLQNALETLIFLNALDKQGNLTSFGKKIAQFPLPPMYSTVVMKAVDYECVEEILTIISMLSVETIFYAPYNKREEVDKIKQRYSSIFGDHISLLRVYQEYSKIHSNPSKWCWDNFINAKSMTKVQSIRKQLKELLGKLDIPLSSSPKDVEPIRKALASGFFLNTAVKIDKNRYKTLLNNVEVRIHPTSMIKQNPQYLIFNSLIDTSRLYIRDVCSIENEWLSEIAPDLFKGRTIIKPNTKETKGYKIERDP